MIATKLNFAKISFKTVVAKAAPAILLMEMMS